MIFVVDDSEDDRELLGAVLRVHGYRVSYANDGTDALRQLESGLRPCLILLDLDMPYVDGVGFRERQLADPRIADIPVVVFSAAADLPKICEELHLPGFQKPAEIGTVVRTVERYRAER
ncbi:MAG TPA: response regulator [Candidatus Binatia bacterium]|nr:response regulator [Candidatus Binatia bacterium]